MEDKNAVHHFFGSNSKAPAHFHCTPGFNYRCFEWSDGRLCCSRNIASVVQKSRKNGEFIWYTDYVNECIELGEKNESKHYGFHDLREAFYQLAFGRETEKKEYVRLLLDIIHAYNDEYHNDPVSGIDVPPHDLVFFVNSVLEIQKVGKSQLSPSIRAELYREIGMYAKCFEFESWAGRNMDEREILAEVMFRAAHYESRPFIIEHCDYCRDNTRFKKRTPCPKVKAER